MGLFGDFDRDKWLAENLLEKQLREAAFSTRTINGLRYVSEITKIEDLRSLPWGDRRLDGSLCCILSRTPNLGPKGLAEVLAFREGKDPKRARPPGPTHVIVPLPDDLIAALDAWIAAQPKPISRPEAIRAFVAAGLHVVGHVE